MRKPVDKETRRKTMKLLIPVIRYMLVCDLVQYALTRLLALAQGREEILRLVLQAGNGADLQALILMAANVAGILSVMGEARGQLRDVKEGMPSILPASFRTPSGRVFAFFLLLASAVAAGVALNGMIGQMGLSSGASQAIPYRGNYLLSLLCYGVLCPFAEELVFRGIFFGGLRRNFALPSAALLSAALFGVWHGNLPQALYGFAMGLLFALGYAMLPDIRMPFGMHALTNAALLTAGYLSL